MAIIPTSAIREVKDISPAEIDLIEAFMQGAIYCWVKNRKDEPFSVRDLMGGENFEWKGTPLYVLYQKHINKGKDRESAVKAAARDLGWLVKSVLSKDKRKFKVEKAGLVSSYKWLGNEP